jgi:hypothetical protein
MRLRRLPEEDGNGAEVEIDEVFGLCGVSVGLARRDAASRGAVAKVKTALTMGDEAAKAETL